MAVKEIDRSKMKEYNIYAGLGGGFGGATYQYTSLYESEEDANQDAFEAACGEYESYEGMNGLPTYSDALDEAMEEMGIWDDDDDEVHDLAWDVYNANREDWIEYYARLTDEDDLDSEEIIRDYIIEDDNNPSEVSSQE